MGLRLCGVVMGLVFCAGEARAELPVPIERNGVTYWAWEDQLGWKTEGCDGFPPGSLKVVKGNGLPCVWKGERPDGTTEAAWMEYDGTKWIEAK